MTLEAFLDRIEGVRSRGQGKWFAICPSHADRSPSLSIREAGNRILVHDFGGCTPKEIMEAMGLTLADLFTNSLSTPDRLLPIPPQKLDLNGLAFRFELGALDRRLRAEHVLNAVENFHPDELDDHQLDQLLNAIARAYGDRKRADFLETVADGFKVKAFHESAGHRAA